MNSAPDSLDQSEPSKALDVKFTDSIRQKIFRAAIGDVLELPSLQDATPLVGGIAWATLKTICASPDLGVGSSSVGVGFLVGEMVGKGVDRATTLDIIEFMVRRAVFSMADEEITVPALDQQIEAQVRVFSNRAQGWQKRSESRREPAKIVKSGASSQSAAPKSADPGEKPTSPLNQVRDLTGAIAEKPAKADRASGAAKKNPLVLCALGGGGESDSVACVFITDGGQEFGVHQSYINSISPTFPRLDILQQLRLAASWCSANASKRKTPRGMPKFINSWLMNAQRDAEIRGAVSRSHAQTNGFGQGATTGSDETSTPNTAGGSDIGAPRPSNLASDFEDLDLSFVAPDGGDCLLGNVGELFDAPDIESGSTPQVTHDAQPLAPSTAGFSRRMPSSILNARASRTRRLSSQPFSAHN